MRLELRQITGNDLERKTCDRPSNANRKPCVVINIAVIERRYRQRAPHQKNVGREALMCQETSFLRQWKSHISGIRAREP